MDLFYTFAGIDPAPSETHKAADGTILCGAARPRFNAAEDWSDNPSDWSMDLINARRYTWKEKLSAREWSGEIHRMHRAYRFERIGMDAGAAGGGVYIQRELIKTKQKISGVEMEVRPIADQKEGPSLVTEADFILYMSKRGDPGVESIWPGLPGDDNLNDALYSGGKDGFNSGLVNAVARREEFFIDRERYLGWTEDRRKALFCLNELIEQCAKVVAATNEEGLYLFTKRGARMFSAVGKKDFMSAYLMLWMAFLAWLKAGPGPRDYSDGDGNCILM